MNITQDELIKKIADEEGIDVTTVRKVFNSAEKNIFAYLSSTAPSEDVQIKILDGLSLDATYVPERTINRGIFQDYNCSSKIKVKSTVTRYYIDKLNGAV